MFIWKAVGGWRWLLWFKLFSASPHFFPRISTKELESAKRRNQRVYCTETTPCWNKAEYSFNMHRVFEHRLAERGLHPNPATEGESDSKQVMIWM